LKNSSLAIFDLDGTLVDTSNSICDTLIETLSELELPNLDRLQIEKSIGLPLDIMLENLNLSSSKKDEVIRVFRDRLFSNLQLGSTAFAGAEAFIDLLQRKSILLSIATSKPTYLAKETIKHSALSRFDFHILGSDGIKPKPDPEIIFKILALHEGVYSAVMFGDREEDIIAAFRAGIPSVGIAQSSHSPSRLIDAGAVLVYGNFKEAINDIDQISELFLTIRRVP